MAGSYSITWEKITLKLITPFRVSYGASAERPAFWVRLADDAGWGEGTIPFYYGIDFADMVAKWQKVSLLNRPYPDDPQEIEEWVGQDGPAPARCGLELALYDRIARMRGLPLYQLLGLPKPKAISTSYTLSIDTPEEMAKMAAKSTQYSELKLKLGSEQDDECLAAIRAARPDAHLRVDANTGWTVEESVRRVKVLEKLGIELIEQPVEKHDIHGMGIVQAATSIPIVADESVQTLENVEQLANVGVKGINLKLMKVGGLTPALRIIKKAQEAGMKIMLGQMVETGIGSAAMAHLSGLADWIDLDVPLLLANDPFDGITYDEHTCLHVPDRPGIGVKLRANY
jgi:L-Ala-D/L-Glu epimerase